MSPGDLCWPSASNQNAQRVPWEEIHRDCWLATAHSKSLMSDYQKKEKQLLDSISQLYKNLGQLEKDVREYEVQERRAKRNHEGDPNLVNKRIKSTVVVKSIDEHQETTETENALPRPAAKAVDRGNARLLQNLLFAPLAQRKKEIEKPDENETKRMELDKIIEEKVEKTPDLIMQHRKEEATKKKLEAEEEMKELQKNIESQEKELNELISAENNGNLTYFALTKTKPAIYFVPRKVDEWSQSTFGFQIPQVHTTEEVKDTETNHIEVEVEVNGS
jgi:hypothetical protein